MRNKKKISSVLLLFVVILLAGCYSTETVFDIDENGKADITFYVLAEQDFAEDEVNTAVWGLMNSFPELQENYNMKQQRKTIDYSNYIIYKFTSKKNTDINSMENIEFAKSKKKYSFIMNIPTLVANVNENNKDDVIFKITVKMPEEIDMTNSSFYNNNKVSWIITREQLEEKITLKAYTK